MFVVRLFITMILYVKNVVLNMAETNRKVVTKMTTKNLYHLKAGSRVFRRARKMSKGKGMSYPEGFGILLENASVGPHAGWDVVEVEMDIKDKEDAAYSFDLLPAKTIKFGKGKGRY